MAGRTTENDNRTQSSFFLCCLLPPCAHSSAASRRRSTRSTPPCPAAASQRAPPWAGPQRQTCSDTSPSSLSPAAASTSASVPRRAAGLAPTSTPPAAKVATDRAQGVGEDSCGAGEATQSSPSAPHHATAPGGGGYNQTVSIVLLMSPNQTKPGQNRAPSPLLSTSIAHTGAPVGLALTCTTCRVFLLPPRL